MIRRRNQGVSLVEVLIAVAMFATVGVTFISFMGQSIGESKFSSDYFTAFILSQKVMEDLAQEISVNPYGFEALGIDENTTKYTDVVDGSSLHFSSLEDQKKPYGKIDLGTDGSINNKMAPLYDIVKKFSFRTTAKRLETAGEGEKRNLYQCNLDFQWAAKTGKGQYAVGCSFFSPITPKKCDLQLQVDEASVDLRIPKEFFNEPTQTLVQIANAKKSTVEAVTAYGRLYLVTQDFITSQYYEKQMKVIANLKQKLASVPANQLDQIFEVRRSIALAWYDLAKACYQIVVYLEPCFTTLQNQNTLSLQTGSSFLNPIMVQRALFDYRIIYEYFTGSMEQARYYYYTLAEKDLASLKGGKKELQVLQKLMDLYRIVALLPGKSDGMAQFRSFLTRLEGYADGKNPSLQRMAKQELIYLQDQTLWLEKYPNLKRISAMVKGRVPEILAFIKKKTDDAVLNSSGNTQTK